jgi:hypothetical protein
MAFIQNTTQNHLDIEDIKNNYVILKNAEVCAVLKTNAVNFDLLAEIEQDAIIAAFSMLLNSISFPIQIVIRSKRLDITKYVEKLVRHEQKITDPLFRKQAEGYRKFVQETIKSNEVLDKNFYVVIPAGNGTNVEANKGPFDFFYKIFSNKSKRVSFNTETVLKKATVELSPKVDHLVKEFNRIGIKSKQMTTQELVELYFDIYNPSSSQGQRIRTNIEDYKTAVVEPAIYE